MTSNNKGVVSDEKTVIADSPGHSTAEVETGTLIQDDNVLSTLGYQPELRRNRSLITLLFQSLAIAAIPYGEGGPLLSAIYGGGQLSIFLGWVSLDYVSRSHRRAPSSVSCRLLSACSTSALHYR